MPATLAQLAQNHARVIIGDPDGAHIFVDYRPQAITPRLLRATHRYQGVPFDDLEADEQQEALDMVTGFLASVLIDWDLLDNSGQRIPPTREGLEDVDYATQLVMLDKIQEHQRLGEQNGARPSGPSSLPTSRKARREASRRRSPSSIRSKQ